MHIPSSLLALLALATSLATANPVDVFNPTGPPIPIPRPAPTSTPKPTPSITPDFSRCNFIQIIRSSIEGPFTLTALSDTLPLQSWPVFLRAPSAKKAQSPYISQTKIRPPLFALNEGSLNNTVGLDGASFPGRFETSYSYAANALERFLFGGKVGGYEIDESSGFYWIQTCDALGNPYQELKAGRGTLPSFFLSLGKLYLLSFFLLLSCSTSDFITIIRCSRKRQKGNREKTILFLKDNKKLSNQDLQLTCPSNNIQNSSSETS